MPSSWGGFIVVKEKLLREKYPTIPYFQILQSKQTQKRNKHPSVDNFFICPPFVWSAVSGNSRKTKKEMPAAPKNTPFPRKNAPPRKSYRTKTFQNAVFPSGFKNNTRISDENISVDNFFNPPPFVSQIKSNTRTCRENEKGPKEKFQKPHQICHK